MKLKQNPVIQTITLDEKEDVLYDSKSGDMHYINAVSRVIFSLFEKGCTKEEAISALLSMFEGDSQQITKEAGAMIDTLVEKGILIPETETADAD